MPAGATGDAGAQVSVSELSYTEASRELDSIVEFFEQGKGTKVVLTHEGCPDDFFCKTVSQGTAESLDKLDLLLAGQAVVSSL